MPDDLAGGGTAAEQEFSNEPVGGSTEPCPTKSKPKTWVKVQLVDDQGRGLADVPYRIELEDGSVRQGTLDRQGIVMLREIEGSTCKVSFPTPGGR